MEGKMNEIDPETRVNFAELTADIVSAYVSNNSVHLSDLPTLIESVYTSLSGTGASFSPEMEKPVPAVPIKKSVTPDYIVSLEDGRHFKSLKRHLGGKGMTPAEYRTKWGLPKEYPMVAPNYAAQRSELAKALGLGQQRRKRAGTVEVDTAAKGKRAGPRKTKTA
jgi:predicted transcriptional regulator